MQKLSIFNNIPKKIMCSLGLFLLPSMAVSMSDEVKETSQIGSISWVKSKVDKYPELK